MMDIVFKAVPRMLVYKWPDYIGKKKKVSSKKKRNHNSVHLTFKQVCYSLGLFAIPGTFDVTKRQ